MLLYDLLISVIGNASDANTVILSGAVALCLLFFTVTVDLIYKLFLRFLPNNLR